MKENNILQPYDILGGYSICDFYTYFPDKIEEGLLDKNLEMRYKETILDEFLDNKGYDTEAIKECWNRFGLIKSVPT